MTHRFDQLRIVGNLFGKTATLSVGFSNDILLENLRGLRFPQGAAVYGFANDSFVVGLLNRSYQPMRQDRGPGFCRLLKNGV